MVERWKVSQAIESLLFDVSCIPCSQALSFEFPLVSWINLSDVYFQPYWSGTENRSWISWWYRMDTTCTWNASSGRREWQVHGNYWWDQVQCLTMPHVNANFSLAWLWSCWFGELFLYQAWCPQVAQLNDLLVGSRYHLEFSSLI